MLGAIGIHQGVALHGRVFRRRVSRAWEARCKVIDVGENL